MNLARRKSFQAGLVLLIVIAIILAGAFAWYNFTQQAVNIFEGWTNPGVNLHDDFEDGQANKDVYVENSGEQPLYVRVKLNEYMEIDQIPMVTGSTKVDPTSWLHHSWSHTSNSDVEDCDLGFHQHYEWVMGGAAKDKDDGSKLYLPAPFSKLALFDRDGYQLLHPQVITYYKDTYSDRTPELLYGTTDNPSDYETTLESLSDAYKRIEATLKEIYGGTPYNDDLIGGTSSFIVGTATKGDYLDWLYALLDDFTRTDAEQVQAELYAFQLAEMLGYYDLPYTLNELANADAYYASTEGDRPDNKKTGGANEVEFDKDTHLTPGEITFVPVKRTLTSDAATDSSGDPIAAAPANGNVYTIAEWILADKPSGDFWIMDTDGWCYWGNILLPGQATGLLLSEVILDEKPTGTWFYGVDVKLEAATYSDIDKFAILGDDGTTEQGNVVLGTISGKYAFWIENGGDGNPDNDVVHTFLDNKDNTYQYMTLSGDKVTYGPLFVYTGDIAASAGTDLYITGDTDNSPYAIGEKFTRDIPGGASDVEFTVVKIGAVYGEAGGPDIDKTGVIQAANGKRYIKLSYDTSSKTAWLDAGPDGKFDPVGGHVDDRLVWTDEDQLPGGATDRFTEEPAVKTLKIGDSFMADGIDWLVIGLDTTTGPTEDKTLIISKEVLEIGVELGNITARLQYYANANPGTGYLDELLTADGDAKAQLLTVDDTFSYFARNLDRVANEKGKTNPAPWWLADDCIVKIDGMQEKVETSASSGLRVALWIDSAKLQEFVNGKS